MLRVLFILAATAAAAPADTVGGITVGQPVPENLSFSRNILGQPVTPVSIAGLTMAGSVTTCGTLVTSVSATAWWRRGAAQYEDGEIGHLRSPDPLGAAQSAFQAMATAMERLGWKQVGWTLDKPPKSGEWEVSASIALEKGELRRTILLKVETSLPEDPWARLDLWTSDPVPCTVGL